MQSCSLLPDIAGRGSDQPLRHSPHRRLISRLVLLSLLVTAGFGAGCNVIGYGAQVIPTVTKAQYKGMLNQTVGVMVWADRGTAIDWQAIQLDLASMIQNQLQASDDKNLKGVTYPWKPESIVRY